MQLVQARRVRKLSNMQQNVLLLAHLVRPLQVAALHGVLSKVLSTSRQCAFGIVFDWEYTISTEVWDYVEASSEFSEATTGWSQDPQTAIWASVWMLRITTVITRAPSAVFCV